jgi:hypothetical protein
MRSLRSGTVLIERVSPETLAWGKMLLRGRAKEAEQMQSRE